MHIPQVVYILCLQGHRIDASEVGLVGATAVVVNLAGVIGHIKIAAGGDKDRDNVGERQGGDERIISGIYHVETLALLHGKHILAEAHHIAALVTIETVVIALGTRHGAVDSARNTHRGHVNDEDASAGRNVSLVGSYSTIGSAVIDAIGRFTEAQDAALLLERRSIKHSQTRSDGAT